MRNAIIESIYSYLRLDNTYLGFIWLEQLCHQMQKHINLVNFPQHKAFVYLQKYSCTKSEAFSFSNQATHSFNK
tara:strand:- start:174 stop:395 length:222 start_codon:yes stop_codon:yes gene_type:complete